jgi:hypothetical protein
MKVRWVMWLEQYGKRIIGRGADTEAEARALAQELATETRRLEPGGHDCLLYRNGEVYDHWIGYAPEKG